MIGTAAWGRSLGSRGEDVARWVVIADVVVVVVVGGREGGSRVIRS